MDIKRTEWNQSYANMDNFLFYPHEEVIRFFSKFVRKKVGLDRYKDIIPYDPNMRILDLGCGIGRHVIYCHEMGLNAYGIDLSDNAIKVAHEWGHNIDFPDVAEKVIQGDVLEMPWENGFFRYAISHGVLDSMPFEIARKACKELTRVMSKDGLFYCDVISGDDSKHSREYDGEETVITEHEQGTIQSYFNLKKIHALFDGYFKVEECILGRRENISVGGYSSRYYMVLSRI